MHDSLDLTGLRQEAQKASEASAFNQKLNRYGLWIFFGTFVLFAIILPSRSGSIPGTITLIIIGILAVVVLLLLLPGITQSFRAFRKSRQDIERIRAYAPACVRRKPTQNLRRILYIAFWFTPVALSIAQVIPVVSAMAFYAVMFIFQMTYRAFFPWAYRGGAVRVDRLLRLFPGNYYLLSYKADFLVLAGQLNSANDILRRLLSEGNYPNAWSLSLLLNNLAGRLMLLENYGETLPMLEAAIRISPGFHYAYDTLASWYLEQNLDPERAVELSDMAIEYGGGSRPVQQATNARALALTGRFTRAEIMLEKVLKAIEHASSLDAAEINRQIGYTYVALGDQEAARKHFENAVTLDTNGIFGNLARRALDTLPVSQ
jgi:tetratricopeptide (TPR) repeat protein